MNISYNENKISQGKENLRQKLKDDKKIRADVEKDLKGYLGL